MAKLHGYITAVLGLATMALPHHLLPTRTTTTFTEAIIKERCYSWTYHPELFLGAGIFLLGILQVLGWSRRALHGGVMVLGGLVVLAGYAMMPVEHYLKMGADLLGMSYNPMIWAGKNSIRAHVGIQLLLYFLGLLTILAGYGGHRGWEVTLSKRQRLRTSYLILQNIRERPFRSFVQVFLVAVASSALFSGTIIMEGSKRGLESLTARIGVDIIVVPEEQSFVAQDILLGTGFRPVYMEEEVLQEVAALPWVEETSPQLYAGSFTYTKLGVPFEAGVVGIEPGSDFTVEPWLARPQDTRMGPEEAIVGYGVKYSRGQRIPLQGREFYVIGTLRRTGMEFFDNSVFITLDEAAGFQGVPGDSISTIHVKVRSQGEAELVAEAIEGIPGVSAIPVRKATAVVRERLDGLFLAFLLLMSAVWLFAVSGISLISSMTVNERKRELGIIRAMGASTGFVLGLFAREAAFIGLVGGVLGSCLGGAVVIGFRKAVTASLKLPFIWPGDLLVVGLALGVVLLSAAVGAMGATLSTRKSVGMEPYELIRVGE
jgi:putative ABC transport system permease protein